MPSEIIARIVDENRKEKGFRVINMNTTEVRDISVDEAIDMMINNRDSIPGAGVFSIRGGRHSIAMDGEEFWGRQHVRFPEISPDGTLTDVQSNNIIFVVTDGVKLIRVCNGLGEIGVIDRNILWKRLPIYIWNTTDGIKEIKSYVPDAEDSELEGSIHNQGAYDYYVRSKMLGRKRYLLSDSLCIPGGVTLLEGIDDDRENNSELEVVPDFVTDIGESAFANSYGLRVQLGKGVKRIGDSAFFNCEGAEIYMNDALETVGNLAFFNWCNLGNRLIIPSTTQTIGEDAFEKSSIEIIEIKPGALRENEDGLRWLCKRWGSRRGEEFTEIIMSEDIAVKIIRYFFNEDSINATFNNSKEFKRMLKRNGWTNIGEQHADKELNKLKVSKEQAEKAIGLLLCHFGNRKVTIV